MPFLRESLNFTVKINVDIVGKSLEAIGNRLHPILDPTHHDVIARAQSMVISSQKQHSESMRQQRTQRKVYPWGFQIVPDNPLQFKRTIVDNLEIRVDLILSVYWDKHPADRPCQLTTAIRVWALNPDLYFRPNMDAAHLEEKINKDHGRVMLRIHFDLANDSQQGPRYHAQVGGTQHAQEWHWFPSSLSVPRLPHSPMDLVLLAELIAATFYPDNYRNIRSDPTWKNAIRVSQDHFLSSYFESAQNALEDQSSVLESMWNVDWE